MDINVFLLCYNESPLLPHTINHYKTNFPSCNITIYDNESTDNSIDIAYSLGCDVISWSSDNIHDENLQIKLRNNIWKDVKSGWIIMADMDEFICIDYNTLLIEKNNGTSILSTIGLEMIGESKTLDLSDINLQHITKYIFNPSENKNIVFLRDKITDMNFGPGSHTCNPVGDVHFSHNTYYIKHMNYLGLDYLINKLTKRYQRNEKMRQQGANTHYTDNVQEITDRYNNALNNFHIFPNK